MDMSSVAKQATNPATWSLFSPELYAPHGMCFLWEFPLTTLHVVANAIITISYLSIAWSLYKLVVRRTDIVYSWLVVCFSMFICLCGLTHAFDILVIWYPEYPLQGVLLLWTGIVSSITAWSLNHMLPFAYRLPSMKDIQDHNRLLEERVGERTAELEKALKEKRFCCKKFITESRTTCKLLRP
jgi:two-component system sensor histidine kinase/response regulator